MTVIFSSEELFQRGPEEGSQRRWEGFVRRFRALLSDSASDGRLCAHIGKAQRAFENPGEDVTETVDGRLPGCVP